MHPFQMEQLARDHQQDLLADARPAPRREWQLRRALRKSHR